jgi:hypothetical protein
MSQLVMMLSTHPFFLNLNIIVLFIVSYIRALLVGTHDESCIWSLLTV